MFHVERVGKHNLFHLRFKEPQWLNWHWIRIEEFYESPDKQVKGFCNTIEQLVERELIKDNAFTYLSDWDGFNIPGHVWEYFFAKHGDDVRECEWDMYNAIQEYEPVAPFYVIGTSDESCRTTLPHETRHGLWYLYDDYRREMLEAMSVYPTAQIRKRLLEAGYCHEVLDDEVQAYLLTGLEEGMNNSKQVQDLRKLLKKVEKKFLV